MSKVLANVECRKKKHVKGKYRKENVEQKKCLQVNEGEGEDKIGARQLLDSLGLLIGENKK